MKVTNALRPRAVRIAVLALVATLLLGTGTASARSIYVNDDRPVTPAPSSCDDPEFNAIQPAVDAAAPGDRVLVCSGTYNEQVKVTKRLALIGIGRPEIKPPTPVAVAPPGALVEFAGAEHGCVHHRLPHRRPARGSRQLRDGLHRGLGAAIRHRDRHPQRDPRHPR